LNEAEASAEKPFWVEIVPVYVKIALSESGPIWRVSQPTFQATEKFKMPGFQRRGEVIVVFHHMLFVAGFGCLSV
jgi:hypothetical protein